MRGDQSRLQVTVHGQEEEEEEDEEERITPIRNGESGRQQLSQTPPLKAFLTNQLRGGKPTLTSRNFLSSVSRPRPSGSVQSTLTRPAQSSLPQKELRLSSSPARQSSPEDSFNSSFSFIQQSLSSGQRTDTNAAPVQKAEPLNLPSRTPNHTATKTNTFLMEHKQSTPVPPSGASRGEKEETSSGERFMYHLPDCEFQPPDVEVTSSLSVDSDTASASSVTSGYESATPASEQGWDTLVKKYEGVLQDCLQSNRTYTKIESMMLKLQRLQQKAILDDDYDAAERFGKKLEELCRERGALKLGLPSRQPSVALFLERLRQVVHGAIQRNDCSQRKAEPDTGEQSDLLQQRDHLIQEKRLVEGQISELQQRLAELKEHSRYLEQQIQLEEQQLEAKELESSVLRSCTMAQLRDMSRTLQDLITSENRARISVCPPPSTLRLQEEEQVLNLSIKEATAKVVMSQRLGSSLRRKVSETDTQLLALHEAKLAAISGNDFSSAKELKAEMKAVYLERDRLEALAKRLHSLSSGSSQELAGMKEQRQQLRQELEQREAQHERRLKENTVKYVELLEGRLHSCGCSGLERIWEADLEVCHLFLRGLQLRTPSCSEADIEDLPSAHVGLPIPPCTKEEEDCAMLTALGGRWCPEANLQNSEFTKKLEEFLFCMEENHAEDVCSEAEAADLMERCELISDRLMALEDELQTALLKQDRALTQSLETEVQQVKSTLQAMLAQLKVEEEEEEEGEELNDLMKNGTLEEEEEEEEEEDQYFSDSWDI
ncbi:disrupted in schizophrenia 1 protein isoform X2 [Nothobranchius furzeri]|nr:transcript variant X2 [Nothobranchius furzeri]